MLSKALPKAGTRLAPLARRLAALSAESPGALLVASKAWWALLRAITIATTIITNRRRQFRPGNDPMTVIHDLVEDWIQIRSTLQRQLKMLQSGEASSESYISENEKTATIARIKGCIEEMNALLKEHARVHQL
ncbi:hypothetical protein [Telmatospirillum sp.]|uniref:hypothetical protein n=1 Tax=Telmatospirillum sp. TaxID=2079197 RepID=UPI00283EE388|nr:hypothetical protein [Telmatospirillum sp.]MDR3436106.1 hypothetical protein [Telmatospirillum sp.]